MDENVNKYFTTKNIIFFIMIVLFLIFLNKVADIALMFFAAFVVSATLVPFVDRLSKYMPRVLATSIVLLIGLVIILLIFIPLIIFTAKQGIILLQNLPDTLRGIQGSLANIKFFGIDFSKFLSSEKIYDFGSNFAGDFVTKSVNITKVIVNAGTTIIAVSIMVFYICYDKISMKKGFIALFPEKFKSKATIILDSIATRVGGYVFAQVLAMVFVGAATTVGLLILGNEHAIILGFITCIFDIIPVIGPTAAVAIGLFAVAPQGFWCVVTTFIVYIIAQVLQNQLLRPIIFGKLMDMHPLTIIISLLVGAKFLGFWGVILGPAIASVICVLIDELYIKPINNLDLTPNGSFANALSENAHGIEEKKEKPKD